MKQDETAKIVERLENNELVKKFMNVDESIPHDHQGIYPYSSSWDWLMPVVEQIETLGYRFGISTTYVRVNTCKESWDDCEEYNCAAFDGKLNTVYHAVVEFIKWHNTQDGMMEEYKILANKKQLETFGVDYDVTGKIGRLVKKYSTGWFCIEVDYDIEGFGFTSTFDIPKTFLKLIEDEENKF